MHYYTPFIEQVVIPEVVRVRRHFDPSYIEDAGTAVRDAIRDAALEETVQEGMRVAITAGSRGIDRIREVIRAVVLYCKERGAHPFIIPAMGSHGGGTAEGQRQVIESYGITEEYCGAPIVSSMEVKQIGISPAGHAVSIDRHAAEADAIIALNRIKAHTAYQGTYESGIVKMLAVGLGKHEGAKRIHARGFTEITALLPDFAECVIQNAPLTFALGIVENAYDKICVLQAIAPGRIMEEEPRLLAVAKERMGVLPFRELDVLVIDEIGKNISGEGADPNVTGRFPTPFATGNIHVGKMVCLGVSKDSHGNAYGIGLFDTVSQRMIDAVDWNSTFINACTNSLLHTVKTPVIMQNDRDAIRMALRASNAKDMAAQRLVHIRNTAQVTEYEISAALVPEAEAMPDMEILGCPQPMRFDVQGNVSW